VVERIQEIASVQVEQKEDLSYEDEGGFMFADMDEEEEIEVKPKKVKLLKVPFDI